MTIHDEETAGVAALEPVIDDLVRRLTLEAKVRLLSGADNFSLHADASIGLEGLVLSDGPTGVRGEIVVGGRESCLLPNASLLAQTWNPEALAEAVDAFAGLDRELLVHPGVAVGAGHVADRPGQRGGEHLAVLDELDEPRPGAVHAQGAQTAATAAPAPAGGLLVSTEKVVVPLAVALLLASGGLVVVLGRLAEKAREFAEIRAMPHYDGPGVVRTAAAALASAERIRPPS